MAKCTENTKKNTDFHALKWSSGQGNQHYTLEMDQTTTHKNEIKKRKWRWLGHTFGKPPETITRQAITWNPQGRGKEVGHETPGREIQKNKQEMGYTRRETERMATDRKQWHCLVGGLCSQRANRHK